MITISLCMIVKNEENTLERCLSSVADAVDEIVVVDTGSTDGTKAVAAKFTDKIYDFAWIDDFSAARNASFDRATMDYILWLDADDIILPEDLIKLKALKETLDPEIESVTMLYNTGFDEQGRVTFSYRRERLVKAKSHFRWKEPVHEYLEIIGRTLDSDVCVTHAKQGRRPAGRNLRIYERLLEEGKTLSPRGTYYYARELKDNGRFEDASDRFRQFLDSGLGWVEDNITACGELARCCLALGDDKSALAALYRSFEYDTPRGEICCQIGYLFKERGSFRLAAFWFGLALSLKKPENSRGFYQPDCWGYIPSLESAVCYDRLGDYATAASFNDLAGFFKPDSPAVSYNKNYFAQRKSAAEEKAPGGQADVPADIPGS